jgi:hypothetical protein
VNFDVPLSVARHRIGCCALDIRRAKTEILCAIRDSRQRPFLGSRVLDILLCPEISLAVSLEQPVSTS